MKNNHDDRVDMYKRQLGGTNAALNRARQKEKELLSIIQELYEALPEEKAAEFAPKLAKLSRSR